MFGELVDTLGEHLEVVLQRQAGWPSGLEFVVLHARRCRRLLRVRHAAECRGDGERGRCKDLAHALLLVKARSLRQWLPGCQRTAAGGFQSSRATTPCRS